MEMSTLTMKEKNDNLKDETRHDIVCVEYETREQFDLECVHQKTDNTVQTTPSLNTCSHVYL